MAARHEGGEEEADRGVEEGERHQARAWPRWGRDHPAAQGRTGAELTVRGVTAHVDVEGSGHFQHYDAASAPPRTIFGAGAWKAKRLVSFKPIGTWGVITAGEAVIEIELRQTMPSPAAVSATLKVVCNVGSGGFDTGQPEGFTLTVPGAPYGAFVPIGAGITVFTIIPAAD